MANFFTKMLVASVMASTSPAFAQDACNDVLKEGPYSYQTYRDDSSFNQIIWSRFLKSSYESSKIDRSAGFGVPVGEIVLGGNYSEADYNAKKAQIEAVYFNQVTATREIDVALMSGDEEVLKAWTSCMQDRGGGMTVRFEPLSPTDVFMIVEYFNQGNRNSDKLARDVTLPQGVVAAAGGHCLRRNKRIVNGKSCTATL